MVTTESIIAALKHLGPSSPTAIANHLRIEPEALKYLAKGLIEAGTILAKGNTTARAYLLPGQKYDPGAPVKLTKQPKKKANGKRRKSRKPRVRAAAVARKASPPQPEILPAMAAGRRLVIFRRGAEPQVFSREESLAIADLVFEEYEAE